MLIFSSFSVVGVGGLCVVCFRGLGGDGCIVGFGFVPAVSTQAKPPEPMRQLFKRMLSAGRFQLAFPNYDDIPPHCYQPLFHFGVAHAVAFYLLLPKVGMALWHGVEMAVFVSVPETAVYEYDRVAAADHDVGRAGQPLYVHPESVALTEQELSHHQLRLGVCAANPRHYKAALFF